MPEPNAESQKNLLDQYDLSEPEPEAIPAPPPVGGESQPAAPPIERPRNPDGTFAPAPKPNEHPKRLIRMASELGMSPEEIAETPTAELRETIRDARMERFFQERATATERSLSPAAETPAPYEVGLDKEQYDPQLISLFEKQGKEIAELRKQLQEVKGFQHQRVQESIADQLDRGFSKHESVLGKGGRGDMTPDSADYLKRMAVIDLIKRDQSKAPLQSKIDKAVSVLFGSKEPAAAPAAQRTETEEAWNRGGLARPTQRAGSTEPLGVEKAVKAVAALQRENGVHVPTTKDEFL